VRIKSVVPCGKCGSKIFYLYDDPLCQTCDKLRIVPNNDALTIINNFIDKYRTLLFGEIRHFNKNELLSLVFWEREKIIRDFYINYTPIDQEGLATCNLLLKRVIRMNDFINDRQISDPNSIVEAYRTIVRLEYILEQVKVGNIALLLTATYDINNLMDLAIRDVIYCETEEYQKIKKIMEKFNVMPEEKAIKKMDTWRSELGHIIPGSKKSNNASETITRFFETISMWYTGLFSNKLYRSAFGLAQREEITIKPFSLKIFATSYEARANEVTRTTYPHFLQQSKKYFEKDSDQIIRHFVLSEEHPDANPLFLRLGDSVLVSPHFTEFFSYVLHAILDRDIFEKEVEKRSRVFESDIVRQEFEKQGFRYLPNQGIKNKMEIDGIAVSNLKAYVIEVKGWKAKDLIQDSYTREILEEEIRNAIDGLSFTRDSRNTRKKVPLPQKVEWVKSHRGNLGISENADIIGMLVINREPVISEYKGCIIRYVDDFEFN
jgi:hypothetical protein